MNLEVNLKSTRKMQAIARKIIEVDPKFQKVIDNSPLCDIGSKKIKSSHFKTLVQSIISQQLATKAAETITLRVSDLIQDEYRPEVFLKFSTKELRNVGISSAKARAITELSIASIEKRVSFDKIHLLPNSVITEELTKIWGIGRWTIEMFLIFHLGRLDVWPVGDLAVRRGWMKIHNLKAEIDPSVLDKKGLKFSGFQSVVAWYCWRAVEN
ncbi:MAG: DNA-3-methyladenine glycosylase 2 family protein [Actinobacteria bacterium]|nr:DNA-3-methyladenine glycosylase 2 family protein [Actinomycetota bacterium]